VKERKSYDIFSYVYTEVTTISLTVHGSLQITAQEYPLKHYTKHINEEHFTDGHNLVKALPLEKTQVITRWDILLRSCIQKAAGLYWCIVTVIR